MDTAAFQPFLLPCGTKLKNRIVKAAMEENMADGTRYNQPSQEMIHLHRRWAEGGAGLILSGHIMVDPAAMGAPGATLLAEDVYNLQDENVWKQWINVSRQNNTRFVLQLNHPGRQIRKGAGLAIYGPSPIAVNIGKMSKHVFDTPIEMDEERIQDVIRRFAWSARKAKELGADGVEIHAAHGYLISSFLSPKSNQRQDSWGGSLENRSRLLFEVLKAMRAAVGSEFALAVKINSADFQRGGFSPDDLLWVVEQLKMFNIDFLELSGGSYESPAMFGAEQKKEIVKKAKQQRASTVAREAYFLKAATAIQDKASMPLLITGGIRTKSALDAVMKSSPRALAGLATAIGLIPDLPNAWARGEDPHTEVSDSWVLPGTLEYAAKTAQVQYNMQLAGSDRTMKPGIWPVIAMLAGMWREMLYFRQYKAWVFPWLASREQAKNSL